MQHSELTKSNSFPDKVYVNFDVLRTEKFCILITFAVPISNLVSSVSRTEKQFLRLLSSNQLILFVNGPGDQQLARRSAGAVDGGTTGAASQGRGLHEAPSASLKRVEAPRSLDRTTSPGGGDQERRETAARK
jgi:hypothetical protein